MEHEKGKQKFGEVAGHIQNVHQILDQVGVDIDTLKRRMALFDSQSDKTPPNRICGDSNQTLKQKNRTSTPSDRQHPSMKEKFTSFSTRNRAIPRFPNKLPPPSNRKPLRPFSLAPPRESSDAGAKPAGKLKKNKTSPSLKGGSGSKLSNTKSKTILRGASTDLKHTSKDSVPICRSGPKKIHVDIIPSKSTTASSQTKLLKQKMKKKSVPISVKQRSSETQQLSDKTIVGKKPVNSEIKIKSKETDSVKDPEHLPADPLLKESISSSDEYFWEEESELENCDSFSLNSASNIFDPCAYDPTESDQLMYPATTTMRKSLKLKTMSNEDQSSLKSVDCNKTTTQDVTPQRMMTGTDCSITQAEDYSSSQLSKSSENASSDLIVQPLFNSRKELREAKVISSKPCYAEHMSDGSSPFNELTTLHPTSKPLLSIASSEGQTNCNSTKSTNSQEMDQRKKHLGIFYGFTPIKQAISCFNSYVDKNEKKFLHEKPNETSEGKEEIHQTIVLNKTESPGVQMFSVQNAIQKFENNTENSIFKNKEVLNSVSNDAMQLQKQKAADFSLTPKTVNDVLNSTSEKDALKESCFEASTTQTVHKYKEHKCSFQGDGPLEEVAEKSDDSPPLLSSLSSWQWFQQCCNEANFVTTRRDAGDRVPHFDQPLKIKVSEIVESLNENVKHIPTSIGKRRISLLELKEPNFTSEKAMELESTSEKKPEMLEDCVDNEIYGFAGSFLEGLLENGENKHSSSGEENYKESKNSSVEEQSCFVVESRQLLNCDEIVCFNTDVMTRKQSKIKEGISTEAPITDNADFVPYENITISCDSHASNTDISYGPQFQLCFCKSPNEINQYCLFLKDLLTSNGINFEAATSEEIIQKLETFQNLLIKVKSEDILSQLWEDDAGKRKTLQEEERPPLYNNPGALRRVLNAGFWLSRVTSRFVGDTIYSVAVTVAAIAVFKFCVIEMVVERDPEGKNFFSDGMISFSRVPSFNNVY